MSYFTCKNLFLWVVLALVNLALHAQEERNSQFMKDLTTISFQETHRPQWHFSVPSGWMNDPNGLLYHEGVYHLFYQYYPDALVWGPMHWGHATSRDMYHWEHHPIALFPDELGYIFSGSAIADTQNRSGLGRDGIVPLLAFYTYHQADFEKEGRTDYQYQGMAYSLDQGMTWTKYKGNPIISNNGMKDFRDPKVFWDAERERFVQLLVGGDRLLVYTSEDLLEWTFRSEFGADRGAHGGVWECPDLFPLKDPTTGETRWVLLISINPGGPNGGSATQYFIGDFDGENFTSTQEEIRWLDWGTDNYAGVTYNGMPDEERLFIGWMSNWNYGQQVPTSPWRSAMTVPRTLSLELVGNEVLVRAQPYKKLAPVEEENAVTLEELNVGESWKVAGLATSRLEFSSVEGARIRIGNEEGEWVEITLPKGGGDLCLNRSRSGATNFEPRFAEAPQCMPVSGSDQNYVLLLDVSSLELFADKGTAVMTTLVFPSAPYQKIQVIAGSLQSLKLTPIKSIHQSGISKN